MKLLRLFNFVTLFFHVGFLAKIASFVFEEASVNKGHVQLQLKQQPQ